MDKEGKIKINWMKLIVSIAVSEGAGLAGSVFTFQAIPTWYAGLNKPPITPPNWLFSPMWITLYFLMGLALYFVWNKGMGAKGSRLAVTLFFIQLFLNALWSFIFFGLQSLLFGAVEIIFLWFFILATTIEFRDIDRKAGYIMFPYLSWATIATLLNLSILWIN